MYFLYRKTVTDIVRLIWATGCIVQSNMKSKQWYAAEVWYHVTIVGDAFMGGLLFEIPAEFR